jgi:hypothetical protein
MYLGMSIDRDKSSHTQVGLDVRYGTLNQHWLRLVCWDRFFLWMCIDWKQTLAFVGCHVGELLLFIVHLARSGSRQDIV